VCAIVHREGNVLGILGVGRAPAEPDAERAGYRGPRSVTVPGCVAAWGELSARFGRLGLDECLHDAIDVAATGTVATPRVAHLWQTAKRAGIAPWTAPAVGERYAIPGLADTLRAIADRGPSAFYEGPIAARIAACTWLSEADLAAHRTESVTPLAGDYLGTTVHELPPPTQGVAALLGLGILAAAVGDDDGVSRLHRQIEAVKIAFAATLAAVADGVTVDDLLAARSLRGLRAQLTSRAGQAGRIQPRGPSDTSYLACVDGDGLAVSFMQSLAKRFGSGIVAPGCGVLLNNRAHGFARDPAHPNALGPGRRPYHTLIPGMLVDDVTRMVAPFAVMGGPMQPQAHIQLVDALVRRRRDPQEALDAARFMVQDDGCVVLEPGLWDRVEPLRALGHDARPAVDRHQFGVGQAIIARDGVLIGGSDRRGDGSVGVANVQKERAKWS
jgi:gamma-glutamyltranspeptidase / glutathione hydrolase